MSLPDVIKDKSLSRYDLAQVLLHLEGKPLSLLDFPFSKEIYSCRTPEMMLMAGRQVTKSTTLRNILLLDSALLDYFKSLYVVPLKEQASRFSNYYLTRGITESPILKRWRFDTTCVNSVFSKSFTNGSVVQLTYAGKDVDRARGIPNDEVFYDEAQDILWDNIPIINESTAASPYKWKVYSGTPKTMDGTLESLWQRSSQHEWVMPCPSCKRLNVPTREYAYKMLEPSGPSCVYCKAFLNVRDGFWQPMQSSVSEEFLGFHLPQIIVPRNVEYNPRDPGDRPPQPPKAWKEIMKKYRHYPPGVFANEVLGFSYDLGGRLITLRELKESCVLPSMKEMSPLMHHGCNHICAGVDWGISAEKSFTVVAIGGIDNQGKVKILEAKKYFGTDTVEQTKDIARICTKWSVDFIGADFGVGYTNNLILKQILGMHRVVEFQYCRAKNLMAWNGVRYMLDRTMSLNLLFIDMKRKNIIFPPYDEMEIFFEDIMAVYEQVIEGTAQTKKVFMRTPHLPDDFTHALNFLTMTLRRASGSPIINMKTGESIYDELMSEKDLGF